jgi:hypothetical protein
MRLTEIAIRDAFRTHHDVYAKLRGWEIPHHIECWSRARRAFEDGSRPDFDWLYDQLRGRWQAFRRSGGRPWGPVEVLGRFAQLDQRYRALRLTDLVDGDLDGCWRAIEAMSGIKPTKAPSVVAISKFLHFWNPRLFVIVDDAVMWQRVLSRSWLKQQVAQERSRIQALLPNAQCPSADPSCDLVSYLAVLAWSATVMRRHPLITPLFAEYVRANGGTASIDFPIETYDAAAMEWMLLGLTEIPPPGVELVAAC